jgi:hypothetical protein
MVVASNSIVAGRPARIVGEMGDGEGETLDLREAYRKIGNNKTEDD